MKFLQSQFFQSIRGQLLVSFILIALLPALVISAGSLWSGYINGRQQAFDRLNSVSSLKQIEIERWLEEIKNEASTALTEEYAYDRLLTALTLAAEDHYFRFYNGAIRNRFQILVAQSHWLDTLLLLDPQGKVLIATETTREGDDMSSLDCFNRARSQPAFQLSLADPEGKAILYTGIPVFDLSDNLAGVILVQSQAAQVAEILQETTGLGSNGQAYLVNATAMLVRSVDIVNAQQGIVLTPQPAHSQPIETLLENRSTLTGIFRNDQGKRVLGVYRWLPSLEIGLVVEQNLLDAFSIVIASLNVTVFVALVTLALGVVAALWLTRRIAHPLARLANAARNIGDGGLTEEVRLERSDEIGDLARAFNTMTAQLGNLINQLEQRVVERTVELEEANRALKHRALQVETSFKVGRQITSILETQPLLQRIVNLIRQSFGYKQVTIFLVEKEENAQLVLQACSPLQEKNYPILLLDHNSLNGSCAVLNQPVVVNDVRQDKRFLKEKDLEVNSEMVIPLIAADKVIGTLDIESTQLNAFNHEDVLGFQNLADQIAIAIQNAHLYARTRELAVLEERNRLSRELHDSVIQSLYSLNLLAGGWQRLVDNDQHLEIFQYLQKVRQISDQALREMRLLVHQLRPPVLEEVGLLDALHQRLDAVEKRAGIETRLVVDGDLELPYALEEPFYWIAQEALNNAVKHGGPAAISIWLSFEEAEIVLEVQDDGCGFDLSKTQSGGGIGLRTMQERASAIQASLTIKTAPGQGTLIRVAAPYLEN